MLNIQLNANTGEPGMKDLVRQCLLERDSR
jgi:hypothetical protein